MGHISSYMKHSVRSFIQLVSNHEGFHRYFANTTWMFLEQILRLIAGLFVGIWVARYLGVSQFGIFNYSIAVAALFAAVSNLGLDSIVVIDLIRNSDERNKILGTAFWLKLLVSISIFIGALLTFGYMGSESQEDIFILIIMGCSIFQAFDVISFYFQAQVRLKLISLSRLFQLLISSVLKIYLIYIKADLIWFVIIVMVDQISLSIFLLISYKKLNLGFFFDSFNFSIAKRLIKQSWSLMIGGFIIILYMRIDQIMIGRMLGAIDVGLYSAATRISELWYFIPVLLANSVFPSLVNSKINNQNVYNKRLEYLYSFMIWGSIAIAIPTVLGAEFIISTLYGKEYLGGANVLMIQACSGVFVFLGAASAKWFISEGLQRYLAYTTLAGGVLNVILNFIFIPLMGINGAALATLISQILACYLMNLAFKRTRENFFRMTRALNFMKYFR